MAFVDDDLSVAVEQSGVGVPVRDRAHHDEVDEARCLALAATELTDLSIVE